MCFAHNPPPITVNHIPASKGIPAILILRSTL
jgi:hypothetical protein